MLKFAALTAMVALAAAPVAYAQAPAPASAPAQVDVRIGAALGAKVDDYGAREFDYLRDELARSVALAAAKGGVTRIDLVLEDALPNRPTFAMQSRNVQLSLTSIALGGAKISGTVYGPQGARPIRFSFYESDLRNEIGAGIWTDAQRAFDMLGGRLARGDYPDGYQRGEPTSRPSFGVKSAWRTR